MRHMSSKELKVIREKRGATQTELAMALNTSADGAPRAAMTDGVILVAHRVKHSNVL